MNSKKLSSRPRKELILDKARLLFWKRGYERTTMADLSKACGFTSPNLYHYFKSKESVLYGVLHQEMTTLLRDLEDLASAKEDSAVERLNTLVSRTLHFDLSSSCQSGILFDLELRNLSRVHRARIITLRDEWERILIGILQDGIDQRVFSKGIDPKIITYSIASMLLRSRIWFSANGRLSPQEITTQMSKFILRGVTET